MERLMIATDLSAQADRALERAVMLARDLKAELHVIHIVDEELPFSEADRRAAEAVRTIRTHLDRLAPAGDAPVSVEAVFGQDYSAVLSEAEKRGADLIVLGSHRENPVKDAFMGTTAEQLLRHGGWPVLIVRSRPDRPYGKVVVAVDLSMPSKRALSVALRLFPGAEFHIVHAYQVPFSAFLDSPASRTEVSKKHEASLRASLEAEMREFLSDAGSGARLPEPAVHICNGPSSDTVLREAARLQANLLVVGTHGRTGISHVVLGSVAEALIERASCDVLAVRPLPPEKG